MDIHDHGLHWAHANEWTLRPLQIGVNPMKMRVQRASWSGNGCGGRQTTPERGTCRHLHFSPSAAGVAVFGEAWPFLPKRQSCMKPVRVTSVRVWLFWRILIGSTQTCYSGRLVQWEASPDRPHLLFFSVQSLSVHNMK